MFVLWRLLGFRRLLLVLMLRTTWRLARARRRTARTLRSRLPA
jgi:hypothetical protein